MHLVERQRQLRVVGDLAVLDAGPELIDLLEAVPQVDVVAPGRDAAGDGAGAPGDQGFAVAAEFAQHVDVFGIADAAFDQTDVAGADVFDVGEGRAVEFD